MLTYPGRYDKIIWHHLNEMILWSSPGLFPVWHLMVCQGYEVIWALPATATSQCGGQLMNWDSFSKRVVPLGSQTLPPILQGECTCSYSWFIVTYPPGDGVKSCHFQLSKFFAVLQNEVHCTLTSWAPIVGNRLWEKREHLSQHKM